MNILKKEAFFSHSAPFNRVTYTTALIIKLTKLSLPYRKGNSSLEKLDDLSYFTQFFLERYTVFCIDPVLLAPYHALS